MTAIPGSCLCGTVKFEIPGPMHGALNCHCGRCRKQHGAAFRSRVRVRVSDLKWIQEEDVLKYFESSSGFRRGFCGNCGSPIVNHSASDREYGVSLGLLDGDPGVRPELHAFVGSKAPWFEITDSLTQFEDRP